MNRRTGRRFAVRASLCAAISLVGLVLPGMASNSWAATGGSCTFPHGNHQAPVGGGLWSITIHDSISCSAPRLDYATVSADLMINGTSVAAGTGTCTQCEATAARATATAPAGATIKNHGTWDAILPQGWSWVSWPNYCSKISPREVQCVRTGTFTAGKTADLDQVGADLGTIAIG